MIRVQRSWATSLISMERVEVSSALPSIRAPLSSLQRPAPRISLEPGLGLLSGTNKARGFTLSADVDP